MKKYYFYFILICFALNTMAQGRVNIKIPFTPTAPTIDGVKESVWNNAPGDSIKLGFQNEIPTVDGYWKALWDNTYLYVLIVVEDDDHWPAYLAGGSWYNYDQPEIYLDVNDILGDTLGAGDKGTGHYQVQPNFIAGGSGVQGDLVPSQDYRPGGKYCYVVTGENYVFEYALDYTSFKNKAGTALSVSDFEALDSIGFDVTIVDQDEGITTERQRAVWQNIGAVNENYNYMDDAGTITLVQTLPPSGVNSQTRKFISVYPNPVSDYMIVNAEFDKLIITNILGIEVSTIEASEKNVTMEYLPSGIYVIQVYNKENLVGMTKIYKN